MELKSIREDVARATATYMGEDIEFTFRPGMITPKTFGLLTEARSIDEIKEFFSKMIVWWDITDKGKNVPVSEATVEELPMPLIGAFGAAVMKTVPERDAGKGSPGGSPQVISRRSAQPRKK